MTIVGKFGTGGIPSLRRVPFRTPLIGQTGGGQAYWVGEGKPKPLTALDFSRTTLDELKVATISVVTEELLRKSSPSADMILRDALAAAVAERIDIDFIDPAKAASAGVSPASVTNGVAAIASSGNDADAIREDVRALMATFVAANNPPTSGVWIMSSATALALSLMVNPLGQPEFPGVSMAGGTFLGLPVITSEYLAPVTDGGFVILANASDIYFADDGGVMIDVSREASLQMLDNPTNDVVTPTATSLVSMWQWGFQLKSTTQRVTASYTEAITVATGPASALAQSITALSATVDNNQATVNTQITAITTDVAAQATRIDDLSATVDNNQATVNTQITAITTDVAAQATRIDDLEAEVDNFESSLTVRWVTAASLPSGALAAYEVAAQVSSGVYTARTAMMIAAYTDGASTKSVVRFDADNFIVVNYANGSIVTPFTIVGGTVYIHGNMYADGSIVAAKVVAGTLSAFTANMGTLTAGRIVSTDGKVDFNLTSKYLDFWS